MDDKSWNDFLLGNAGVRTGGIMNEVGLESRYKPKTTSPPIRPKPGHPQQPATPQYNPTPRPLTEAEKKRQEKAALRQARIDALPSTAVYWTWWKRFSTLDGRVRSVASFAGTGSILIGIASFVVMGVGAIRSGPNTQLWRCWQPVSFCRCPCSRSMQRAFWKNMVQTPSAPGPV